ncbi:MAG: leucine-rich repeat domain-containing protein, partial [Lachnospiraceae bacterium]|nr:leucine-rich repeat domain-containing protein [Lachnospiraceae bacterium]
MITKSKQLLSLTFFLICCAILFLPYSMKTVCATETCKQSGKYLYEVDVHGNAIFMGYTGTEPEWSIPSEIAGKKVTSIGGMYKKKNLHYKNIIKTVKTLTIPGTVEHIGGYVFQDCSGLEKVIFQEGVSEIGDYAFAECKSLVKVNLPESLTSIKDYAFYGCTNLSDIN